MCTASHCVKLLTAAFAAEYAGTRVSGRNAFIDEMLRIAPSPRSAMCRPNAWHGRMVPIRFRSSVFSSASAGSSKNVRPGPVVASGRLPPAALTRPSTWPKRAITASAARARLAGSRTSASMTIVRAAAWPPSDAQNFSPDAMR
ncbi:MAG: hypothetical protein H6Q10_1558 [Acidobacteria bacterium]|nr:hypothetical protein [Acidobacteriota bacterium]